MGRDLIPLTKLLIHHNTGKTNTVYQKKDLIIIIIIISANVQEQNIFHGERKLHCSTNCKYRTAATVCTLETWFVSGI